MEINEDGHVEINLPKGKRNYYVDLMEMYEGDSTNPDEFFGFRLNTPERQISFVQHLHELLDEEMDFSSKLHVLHYIVNAVNEEL